MMLISRPFKLIKLLLSLALILQLVACTQEPADATVEKSSAAGKVDQPSVSPVNPFATAEPGQRAGGSDKSGASPIASSRQSSQGAVPTKQRNATGLTVPSSPLAAAENAGSQLSFGEISGNAAATAGAAGAKVRYGPGESPAEIAAAAANPGYGPGESPAEIAAAANPGYGPGESPAEIAAAAASPGYGPGESPAEKAAAAANPGYGPGESPADKAAAANPGPGPGGK